jgi:hypothetical protein
MSSTRSWVLAGLRRSRHATLDAALLTGRGGRYVVSRVSIVGFRALLRTVVHAAEIAILARDFPFDFLTPLFATRALPALVTGVQWGALEALRVQVRHENSSGRAGLARAQIECWLGWTLLIASTFAAGLTMLVSRNSLEYGPDGLYGSFAILSGWVLASELVVRTYHAGVFALGRVYRPAWSLFVPDFVEVALLVQTYPRLGPFALHLMVLVGTLLRAGITVHYSRQAYRTRLHETPRLPGLRALARLSRQDVWQAGKHALATLPQQLDRMLLIALLRAPAPDGLSIPLSLPYYALRPVANFAQAWVRTFYADFVRLDVASVTVLRLRFERLLLRVSLLTGGLSALLVLAGSCFLFGVAGLGPALWLTPLSLLRSRFALEQTRAFTYHDLPALLRSGVILVLALLVPWAARVDDRVMLSIVLIALALVAILFGRVRSRAKERRMLLAQRLPVSAWLASLSREQRPVRLGIALADSKVGRPYALLTVLADRLGHGRAARFGKTWLMWWEPEDQALPRVELVTLLGGAAQKLELVEGVTGKQALLNALAAKQLPYDLAQALALPSGARTHQELKDRARTLVPGVLMLDARGESAELSRLSGRELTILRRALIAEAREQDIVPSFSPWHAAVFAPEGEAELVFVYPAHTPRAGLLKRDVRHASWRCSVG